MQERGCDVGTVGKPDGEQPRGVEAVTRGRGYEPVGESVRATRDLRGIEHALGEPREETQRAALVHVAARAVTRRYSGLADQLKLRAPAREKCSMPPPTLAPGALAAITCWGDFSDS